MSLPGYFSLLLFIICITGCGISRHAAGLQSNAETAFEAGNYSAALNYYEELMEHNKRRNREISGTEYYNAGISAWKTGHTGKAAGYLELAGRSGYTSEISVRILAEAYREIDNLSREIDRLEEYVDKFPDGERINEMRRRLFETYIESRNHNLALELWPELDGSATSDPELLESYFILNRIMNNDAGLKEIAEQLKSLDGNNTLALEYLGEHYFWQAENRYQEEMDAYEENRTRQQYRQLLDALDTINEQFRMSRDYFERLWEIEPEPRYAVYLKNIYTRFGNEERAGYFHRQSEKN